MKKEIVLKIGAIVCILIFKNIVGYGQVQTYSIVGTGQTISYDTMHAITMPTSGQAFYGQNSNHPGNTRSYTNNGDGTVTDNVTGLMWQQSPDKNSDGIINRSDQLSYPVALAAAATCNTGGYSDWRLPTIKELYSLFICTGEDPSGYNGTSTVGLIPFIDTTYFKFGYGDLSAGERIIDGNYVSSTLSVSLTCGLQVHAVFGVNFADGRIKGYPITFPGTGDTAYIYSRYVRGNTAYGTNQFVNNGNGTISDNATGLMWMQNDNAQAIYWQNALSYAENYTYAGFSDWRLPDTKELQSIVDYTRSPAATSSAAINPIFNCTQITNEANVADYPCYWSNTTHAAYGGAGGDADYVCFGRAMGYMVPFGGWSDVHGAGAQRSDPKTGSASSYPQGHGPQGDAIRILNYARLVRYVSPSSGINDWNKNKTSVNIYPNPAHDYLSIDISGAINQNASLKIYNSLCQVIFSEKVTMPAQLNIETSKFPSGIYTVNFVNENEVINHKFIKE